MLRVLWIFFSFSIIAAVMVWYRRFHEPSPTSFDLFTLHSLNRTYLSALSLPFPSFAHPPSSPYPLSPSCLTPPPLHILCKSTHIPSVDLDSRYQIAPSFNMCVVGALGSVLLLLPWVRFLWLEVGRVGWVVLRVGLVLV